MIRILTARVSSAEQKNEDLNKRVDWLAQRVDELSGKIIDKLGELGMFKAEVGRRR